MKAYPWGTRLLLRVHTLTGFGVHEIYSFLPLRWVINALDKLAGTPPIWPK